MSAKPENLGSNPGSGSVYLEHDLLQQALDSAAREQYETARRERIHQNERTYELRKGELEKILACVDAELLPGKLKRQVEELGASGARKLEKVTNINNTPRPQSSREVVTRTEIVPMLPCKGYTLPRGNLIAGGIMAGSGFLGGVDERLLLERMRRETMTRLHDALETGTGDHGHDLDSDRRGDEGASVGEGSEMAYI